MGWQRMKRKPNIIICTCDQLRAFEVGCYGNEVIRTHNIDRLASEGVRFQTAVTNFPGCMAARSVLLSGQYNRTCTGGVSNVCYPGLDGETFFPQYPVPGRPHLKDPTLPEILRENGYHTATVGKWHIHSWPHEVGFDSFVIPRVNHCHVGQSYTENGGVEFVPDGYSVDFEADTAEAFLRNGIRHDRPFFLYYNISPPHCPFGDAPPEYLNMYDPGQVPVRANVNLDQPMERQEHWFKVYRWDFRYYNHHLPETMRLPEGYSLRHLIAEYYGMTMWMDAAVGRMLGVLDETGLADETIVVFTSDHGDNLGSHGLVQKGGPNEESVRIPLVIRCPSLGPIPAVNRTHVASLVDVPPTLLSLAGVDIPEHFHGRDLASVCRAEQSGVETSAFIETSGGVALRTTDRMCYVPFTGIEHELAETPSQLYDLIQDPYQLKNLASDASVGEQAAGLDMRLRRWNAEIIWMPLRT